MARFTAILKKTILTLYLAAVHLLAFFAVYHLFVRPYFVQPENYSTRTEDVTKRTLVPTPLPISSPVVKPTVAAPPNPATSQTQNNITEDAPLRLMIPVIGIKREQLQDTFNNARSENRVHNAIDIMAPLGTPVVAVADGEIAKFFDSERGGITIYQYSLDRKRVYYYAHLQKRAENINEKDLIRRGTVIGYVGDTGNAGAGNFHLHFSVTILSDPEKIFEGTEINPYPLLKDGIESRF